MDSELWASRLAAAKRQFIHHHTTTTNNNNNNNHLNSQMDGLNIDDMVEVDEEFACPYCYEEFEIASLCSHLQHQHSSESRLTVCPVCTIKVTRDMLSHITLQHGHLLKMNRRRRLRRVAMPNSSQTLSLLGRDLRESHLQLLLGGVGHRSSSAASYNAINDPLLSSLVLNFPASDVDEISKAVVSCAEDMSTKSVTSQHMWKSSFDPSLSIEEREKRRKQAAGKAAFMQDLFFSCLFSK